MGRIFLERKKRERDYNGKNDIKNEERIMKKIPEANEAEEIQNL